MSILFSYYPLHVQFNHGGALLTAICKGAGIRADYVPCTQLKDKWDGFDTIGFSIVTDFDIHGAIEYDLLKPFIRDAIAAGKRVLLGGAYCKKFGKIDEDVVVCRGEAEDFIVDYLKGNEEAFKPGYVRPSIDGLPFPDLSNVTGYEFHRDQPFLKGKKIIPYQSSRGCFWGRCTFCEVQFQPDKRVRIKHTVADDVKYLKETYNPDLIYLMDTTIPYPLPDWKEQLEKIYTPFQGYIRGDIDPTDLEFLIKHGLKATAFGVESPYESYRNDVLKKGLTNEQLYRTVRILKKHGVTYVPFFIAPTSPIQRREKRDLRVMMQNIGGYPMVWKGLEDLGRNIER